MSYNYMHKKSNHNKKDDKNFINVEFNKYQKTSNPNLNEEKKQKNKKKNENDNQNINNNIQENNINNKELKKELKDSTNKNKEEKEKKPEDRQKDDSSINKYYDEIYKKKEERLWTNYQYVSFKNKIGENSCYVNVIIHFLYIFPCVNDYLIKKYKEKEEKNLKEKEQTKNTNEHKNINNEENEIDEKILNSQNNKDNYISNNNKETIKEIKKENKENSKKINKKDKAFNEFLFYLGKILNNYQNIIISTDDNNNKNKIVTLDTTKLRKSLSIASNGLFKLNSISDPVEFLIYILDLINKENLEEIHKYFHLKLIEETRCYKYCPCKSNKKYDKDNYIYQIYVEEIFNYINKNKLDFDDYKERLFLLSYYSLQNENIKCEKCNSIINKTLICNNKQGRPKFLLINCVWKENKPVIEDVVKFLFLISLVEELDNLFLCPNKEEKDNYYLIGIIFYSFSLCHYINMIFNLQKNIFTLYNDEGIIEFKSLNDLYRYLTLENIKDNNQAYFYPVLLVYGKENIYDEDILPQIKKINQNNYEKLIKECKEEIKNEKKKEEKPLTDEEKHKNYRELVIAQMEHDRKKELNNLLNSNTNRASCENLDYYYKRFRDDNIINGQNKNNLLKASNNKKIKSGSVDKNNCHFNYNGSNPYRNNDNDHDRRLKEILGKDYTYFNNKDYVRNKQGNNKQLLKQKNYY